VIDPRSFREAIRTATVTYPVPYVVSVLLLFSLLCFGGSLTVTDALRWLLASIGAVAALGAVASFGYTLLAKPELLRSESHLLLTRIFDAVGDSDMDTKARERLTRAMLDASGERLSRREVGIEPSSARDRALESKDG
jgi:hypothetical protein